MIIWTTREHIFEARIKVEGIGQEVVLGHQKEHGCGVENGLIWGVFLK